MPRRPIPLRGEVAHSARMVIPLRGGVDAEGGRGGYGVSLEIPANDETQTTHLR